ncbi:hypothetical protein ACFLXE_01810 [Chloroflexota bacterium]
MKAAELKATYLQEDARTTSKVVILEFWGGWHTVDDDSEIPESAMVALRVQPPPTGSDQTASP